MDVLKGASETLKKVEYILLETHLVKYNLNAPKFHELIFFMNSINFLLEVSVAKNEIGKITNLYI